jgi:hypothetical protein
VNFIGDKLERHFNSFEHNIEEYNLFSKKEFNDLTEVRKNLPNGLHLSKTRKLNIPENLLLTISSWDLIYQNPVNHPYWDYHVGYVELSK